MTINCSNLISNFLNIFFQSSLEEESRATEVPLSLKTAVERFIPPPEPSFTRYRRTFDKIFEHSSSYLESGITFDPNQSFPGKAVILGDVKCHVIIPYLLKREWKIKLVDTSREKFRELSNIAKQYYGVPLPLEMTFIEDSIEKYLSSEKDVDLIIAQDTFTSLNSNRFFVIWKNAKEALKEGGRIVGSFQFVSTTQLEYRFKWRITQAEAQVLLQKTGFIQEECPTEPGTPPYQFEFIARKV